MIRLLVAAPASGSGKTMVTCALLKALSRRALAPCAFKCGPDYIDPMFHRAALGVESYNLDLFLSDEAQVRALFQRACQNHGAAVIEGAMGYYDGLGGVSARASAWHVAETLDLPMLLVLPAKGASLTLAATVRGLRDFRERSRLAAIVLNACSPALCAALAPALERETGIPVLGCLPRLDDVRVESRHLGLLTAREIDDLDARLTALSEAFEAHVDMARLLRIFDGPSPAAPVPEAPAPLRCRIAVARDEAFCFAYAETLDSLTRHGAELVFFSPLHDAGLPAGIGGLYLPGGYPELYARALSENEAIRSAVRDAVRGGLPTVAECGGFLYLGETLSDGAGVPYPMAGVLPGCASDTGKLVRFGYATLCAERDSLLFRAGEQFPVHEFHRWDTTQNGGALRFEKPLRDKSWRGGYATATLYAAFPHLYFAGSPILAERFVAAAEEYGVQYGIM